MTEPTPLTARQIAEYDRRFEAGETLWFWCIHHGMRLEPLTEPLSHRIDYINSYKPEHERATRLTWLQPVKQPERLPAEVVAAGKQYAAAWEQCDAALEQCVATREQCDAAWKRHDAVWKQYAADLSTLHHEEYPGCPWVDGRLQFPAKETSRD